MAGLALAGLLFAEAIAALAPVTLRPAADGAGPIAIVVPAHNEAGTIAPTLDNIRAQLRDRDRLIVVADNCTDETAETALRHGAEVLVRNAPEARGKGYALQFAIDALRAAPPAIIVFADADCLFDDGALQKVAGLAAQEGRPVQALYLMKAPAGAGPRWQAAEFAWLFINKVRMSGLQRIFDVTRFTGSGFAAPWRTVEHAKVGSGEIVEDLALSLQLVRAGAAPMLAQDAAVTSLFPTGEAAMTRQAARWSLGSVRFAARSFMALIRQGIEQRNWRLIGAAADLMIPPLTLFIAMLGAVAGLGCATWLATGFFGAFSLGISALVLTGLALFIGWVAYGRDALPPSAIGGGIQFIAAKAKVFGKAGRDSVKQWTPTRGDDAEPRP